MKRCCSVRPNRGAFTLIELLVVIAIIAILAAILFPVFAQAREKARSATCISNLKQIALGVIQYEQDYDDAYPRNNGVELPAYGWQMTWIYNVQPYIKNFNVFACPDDTHKEPNGPLTSYVGNGAFGYDWEFSGGWITEGVIGADFSWVGDYLKPRLASQVNFPASTILLAERWVVTDYGGGYGANSPLGTVATGADGSEMGYGLPGMSATSPEFSAPVNAPGLISVGHQGRSNFAFTDGHVKSMIPMQTVNLTPSQGNSGNSEITGNTFFYMWSAIRPTENL